jgi:5-methylcytosine-specific restriction endonuclease McrBC regulatory subunit McrC
MKEEQTLLCPTNKNDDWNWLSELLQANGPLKNRLSVSLEWIDPKTPTLRVSDKVGSIHFVDPKTRKNLKLIIHPKVPGSITGMLGAILQLPLDNLMRIQEQMTDISILPSIWLASVFIHELERFLTLLRPRGEEHEEELIGQVRGRFLVDSYLKRNYFSRRHVVPCRFVEWTVDNLPNRILLYALFLSRRLLPINIISEFGFARRCESVLAEVQLVRIQKDDFAKVQSLLQGPFRYYKDIIHLAKLIISVLDPFAVESRELENMPIVRAFDTGSSEDGSIKWDLIDMPILFEEYVRRVTRSIDTNKRNFSVLLKGDLPLELVHLANKTIVLDRPPIETILNGNRLVIDAKYKLINTIKNSKTLNNDPDGTYHIIENQQINLRNTLEPDALEMIPPQVKNSDIYQIVAYATHEDIQASSAALIFPTVSDHQDGISPPYYVGLGYSRNGDYGIPVYILTVRIDPSGIKNEVMGMGVLRDINLICSDSCQR